MNFTELSPLRNFLLNFISGFVGVHFFNPGSISVTQVFEDSSDRRMEMGRLSGVLLGDLHLESRCFGQFIVICFKIPCI